ncbi:peptidoglycan DD-metalloendopeptidase family protein [Candidatus Dojkabacteria bacterium]|nr:peptidoglycan DD-metalloendopeptidase family protein [Candidatus Dojkabacteria bacterium]
MKVKFKSKKFIAVFFIISLIFLGVYLKFPQSRILNEISEEEKEVKEWPFRPQPDLVYDSNGTFSDSTRQNLQDLYKSLLIYNCEDLPENPTTTQLQYCSQAALPENNPVKDKLCEIDKDSHRGDMRFLSETFCMNRSIQGIHLESQTPGGEGDPTDTDPETEYPDEEICEVLSDNENIALFASDGNLFLFPLQLDSNPMSLDDVRVTAPYDPTGTINPSYGGNHYGIDFGYVTGTPIVASNFGQVVMSGWYRDIKTGFGGYGNLVVINHTFENGTLFQTRYAHMVNQPLVEVGEFVKPGQIIGYVGSTGWSTGPHIHFETIECTSFGESGACLNEQGGASYNRRDPANVIFFGLEKLENEEVDVECNDIPGNDPKNPTDPSQIDFDSETNSIDDLIDRAAVTVGIPPAVVYAIRGNETSNCALTWAGWRGITGIDDNTDLTDRSLTNNSTSRDAQDTTACSGNPDQIAFASPNLSTSWDVRGVTQFVAESEHPNSFFNGYISGAYESVMSQCVDALHEHIPTNQRLQISVPPVGDICRDKVSLNCIEKYPGYDNQSVQPGKFSRHIVSHAVCATTIKLWADSGRISTDEWTDEKVYNVAWDYYGHGSDAPAACNGKIDGDNDYCERAVNRYHERI